MRETKKKLTLSQRTMILLALGVLLTAIAMKTSRQPILPSLGEPASWLLILIPVIMCFTKHGDKEGFFRKHYKTSFWTVVLFTIPVYCLTVSIIFNCGHGDNVGIRLASAVFAFLIGFNLIFLGTPLCFKFLRGSDEYLEHQRTGDGEPQALQSADCGTSSAENNTEQNE